VGKFPLRQPQQRLVRDCVPSICILLHRHYIDYTASRINMVFLPFSSSSVWSGLLSFFYRFFSCVVPLRPPDQGVAGFAICLSPALFSQSLLFLEIEAIYRTSTSKPTSTFAAPSFSFSRSFPSSFLFSDFSRQSTLIFLSSDGLGEPWTPDRPNDAFSSNSSSFGFLPVFFFLSQTRLRSW